MNKSYLFRSIGIVILVYLLWAVVDLKELRAKFASIDPLVFLWILPFHWLQWIMRVHRCMLLIRHPRIHLRFHEVFALTASGFFIGCLSPGRIGEVVKVKGLTNVGYPVRRAFLSFLFERLSDVVGLLFFVTFGCVVCYSLLPNGLIYIEIIAVGAVLAGIVAALNRSRVKRLVFYFLPGKIRSILENELDAVKDAVRAVTLKSWMIVLVYSILIWALNCWMIYTLFEATSFTLPLEYGISFTAFGSLAGLLPFSIYGVGIREAFLIEPFRLFGFSSSDANLAAVTLGMMYLVILLYHIFLGFVSWMSPGMRRFIEPSNSECSIDD